MVLEPYMLEAEIIPGILEKNWKEIEDKILVVSAFANVIHVDLIDGKFSTNATFFEAAPFQKYTKDYLFELHMMVDNPEQYLEQWAKAGFRRFIGQVEKMPDIAAFVAKAQLLGEVGLAIDSPTPVEKIASVSLEDLDVVLVMTVKAGLSRQKFLPEDLEKIKTIRKKSAFIPIETDGGVSVETLIQARNAGATRFVTTGFLFDSSSAQEQYALLERTLRETAGTT